MFEFLEAYSRVGGREVSICTTAGHPDVRVESGWLDPQPNARSVNYEVVTSEGQADSAALVSADFSKEDDGSRVVVTVQLSSLAQNLEAGYQQGFSVGLNNLAEVAARTMVLTRVIRAPRTVIWGACVNPQTLPQWWGPDGFDCQTDRIDLRTGGQCLFDMIGPDGTVFPNHHLYREVRPEDRIAYALLAGENGPKHADAWATFEDTDDATTVTLGMVFQAPTRGRSSRHEPQQRPLRRGPVEGRVARGEKALEGALDTQQVLTPRAVKPAFAQLAVRCGLELNIGRFAKRRSGFWGNN